VTKRLYTRNIIIIIIIIIKSTQGRVVIPLRDLVISLDLPVLQLRVRDGHVRDEEEQEEGG
jgi:hypothetical protein